MFRTRFTPRVPVRQNFEKPSRTQQQFKEECDINNILARYQKTGTIAHLMKSEPQYGDFSSMPDYLEAMQLVEVAHEQFMALPAKLRDQLQNDPARFLDWVNDDANLDQMVDLGLAKRNPESDQLERQDPQSSSEERN